MEKLRYVGSWSLIPELSFYEQGAPPDAAEYMIGFAGGAVHLSISWTGIVALIRNG
ncbi:hypothetical protein FIU97_20525 (plasmid) [Roseivivax sp. THAF40]|uniref:hypothetical protein n=1 Tax=Roseivivax sp. THAF40 TaxID=2587858 RepID=UPI0012A93D30|nr:hypothetical protein [Roseivivax sp. THAF40]QFT48987.1 hypothetical protein FIU97_20525 [Roseivivax sp. THAF40]